MSKYEAKKFKVGDKVRIVNPNSSYKPCDKIPHRITEIEKTLLGLDCYALDGDSAYNWFDDELEIVEFKKGDIVELDLDCPLKSIFRSNELYSFLGTKKLLTGEISILACSEYKVVKAFTNIDNDTGLILKGINESDEIGYLDAALFKLVRRPEKVKEVTMAEVEEKFGCKIKIIKENEK